MFFSLMSEAELYVVQRTSCSFPASDLFIFFACFSQFVGALDLPFVLKVAQFSSAHLASFFSVVMLF